MRVSPFLAASLLVCATYAWACSNDDSTPSSTADAGAGHTDAGGSTTGTGDGTHGGGGCVAYVDDAGTIPGDCIIARVNGTSLFSSQAGCPAGSTFVDSCPTDTLYGCCSTIGGSGGNATNVEEDCAYAATDEDGGGNYLESQSACTSIGGTWSTTP
jgi:hypothetical protein